MLSQVQAQITKQRNEGNRVFQDLQRETKKAFVEPSPATHTIFRLLKAGERVFQTLY